MTVIDTMGRYPGLFFNIRAATERGVRYLVITSRRIIVPAFCANRQSRFVSSDAPACRRQQLNQRCEQRELETEGFESAYSCAEQIAVSKE